MFLCNTTITYSMLKKKAQMIVYHIAREKEVRDEWRTSYANMHENPADIFMKVLPMSEKQWGFVQMLKHHIFGSFPEATVVEQCWNAC